MQSKSHRIVDYGGNWLQVSTHEKLVWVNGSGLLYEEYEKLVERTKDVWIKFIMVPDGNGGQIEKMVPWNYDFDSLPRILRDHIEEQDEKMFHRYYSYFKGVSAEEYNRRLERLEKIIPDFTDGDFQRYVMLGHPLPTPQYKKALDSARRAYGKVKALLMCNINDFSEFVTLTFANESSREKLEGFGANFIYVEGTDFESVKNAFTDWMEALQRRAKSKGYSIKYICVWEMTEKGVYHFHLVTNTVLDSEKLKNPDWLDYDNRTKQYKNSIGLGSWMHGKSDIQRIKDHSRISTYLSKYILKSIWNIHEDEELIERYKGKKKYFTSRGLQKPDVSYMDYFDDQFEEDPYVTEVINPYNQGAIKNEIYTFVSGQEKDAILEIAPMGKANIKIS